MSRRQLMQGSAGFGLAALLAACGTNDSEAFSTPESNTSTTAGEPTTSQSTEAAESTDPATDPTPVRDLAVAFTYAFGDDGKKLNPYVAVWIEDDEGNLLRTNALWFQQTDKGPRWLPDLKRWFVVDEANSEVDAIETISSATRRPGSYNVVWDGLDEAGGQVTGTIFVCIESSRERGPYSLIRESYDMTTIGTTLLESDGELSEASVTGV